MNSESPQRFKVPISARLTLLKTILGFFAVAFTISSLAAGSDSGVVLFPAAEHESRSFLIRHEGIVENAGQRSAESVDEISATVEVLAIVSPTRSRLRWTYGSCRSGEQYLSLEGVQVDFALDHGRLDRTSLDREAIRRQLISRLSARAKELRATNASDAIERAGKIEDLAIPALVRKPLFAAAGVAIDPVLGLFDVYGLRYKVGSTLTQSESIHVPEGDAPLPVQTAVSASRSKTDPGQLVISAESRFDQVVAITQLIKIIKRSLDASAAAAPLPDDEELRKKVASTNPQSTNRSTTRVRLPNYDLVETVSESQFTSTVFSSSERFVVTPLPESE